MSKASVIWTTAALDDLLDIEDFIGDPSRSEAIIDRILARARQLEDFPESGRQQSTQTKQDYRYENLGECSLPLGVRGGGGIIFRESPSY